MLIYLLRHGLTEYNAEKRYQGQRDIPLSAAGRAMLCRADISPKTVYITPLCRTRQTAEALGLGVPVWSLCSLHRDRSRGMRTPLRRIVSDPAVVSPIFSHGSTRPETVREAAACATSPPAVWTPATSSAENFAMPSSGPRWWRPVQA